VAYFFGRAVRRWTRS